MLLLIPSEQRRRLLHLHWVPYVLPHTPAWLWDYIHGLARSRHGGMWQYTSAVQSDLVNYILQSHAGYHSLLDIACNMGFMLAQLQRARPVSKNYGSDISRAMVSAARLRCPECAGFAPFDLALLANNDSTSMEAGVRALAPGLPKTVDLVVVSDVLYFLPFANLPPILARVSPASVVRESQRRLMDALARLAHREVIFSDHEDNPLVVDFLEANGATRHLLPPTRRGRMRSVWTVEGRAKR